MVIPPCDEDCSIPSFAFGGGGEVPHKWKYAIITPQKQGSDRVWQLQGYLAGSARRPDILLAIIAHRVRQLQGYLAGSARRQDILLKIIAHSLSEYYERDGILPEQQNGFWPNQSTTDMMFVIRRLQELARNKRIPLYVCFNDLTKAYDLVDQTLFWRVLARFVVPQKK